jgi:IclR family acetate operon transcriptional repressor
VYFAYVKYTQVMVDETNGAGSSNGAGAGPLQAQVKSATRTLDIIEYIVATDRALVAQEIATALAIPVSSLSYLLATLVERGYLLRQGRRYTAGPGLARLQTRGARFTLAERVQPLVRTLRVQLNETASFFIRSGWEMEAIATETSDQALRYAVPTGTRLPMHALASGKALLAELPEDELDRYFGESKREKFTPSTVIGEGPLRKQIAAIRKSGFAMTADEFSLGIRGIGRAVTIDGEVVGAISVALPQPRYSEAVERRVKDLLGRTVDLLAST